MWMFIATLLITAQNWERAQVSINRWMHDQIAVVSHNGIQLSSKKKPPADVRTRMDEFKCFMLSERNHTPEVTQSLLLFIWYFWKGKTTVIERSVVSGIRRWVGGEGPRGNFLRWQKCSVSQLWWLLHNCTRLFKTHWRVQLKLLSLVYGNDAPTKLTSKKRSYRICCVVEYHLY